MLVAGLIVLTGAILLIVSYLLVRSNLASTPTTLGNLSGDTSGPTLKATSSAAPAVPSFVLATPRSIGLVRTQIEHHTLGALITQYGLVLASLIAVAVVIAWLIAGRVLSPLRAITSAARRITRDHLGERLALRGPHDELRELGDTFDSMLGRLEMAFEDQQLFAANAAHELRTLLTILHAELDVAMRSDPVECEDWGALSARLLRTVVSCEALVERLLNLAYGPLAPGDRAPVAMDDLVREEVASNQFAAALSEVDLRTDLRHAVTWGDAFLLSQLVNNLIDNAFKYHEGGWITVAARMDGQDAILEVSNSGRLLGRDETHRLVEPFQRGEMPRVGNSFGLGLSIVRTIVHAHDGELSLEPLISGGMTVRITFPGSDQEAPTIEKSVVMQR
jgi:signal transduction histidine kinase